MILSVQENTFWRCVELLILHVGEVCWLILHVITHWHVSVLMLRHVSLVLPSVLWIGLGLRIVLILDRYGYWHVLVRLILVIVAIIWLYNLAVVGFITLVCLARHIMLLLLPKLTTAMGKTTLFIVGACSLLVEFAQFSLIVGSWLWVYKLSLLTSPVVVLLAIHSAFHHWILALSHHSWALVSVLSRWILWSVITTSTTIVVTTTGSETSTTSITLESLLLRHWLLNSKIILIWSHLGYRNLVIEVSVGLHLRRLGKTSSTSLVSLVVVVEPTSSAGHSTATAWKSLMVGGSIRVWLFQLSFSVSKNTLFTNHTVSTILEMSAHLSLVLWVVDVGTRVEILLSRLMLVVELVLIRVRLIFICLWHSEIHLIQIWIVNSLIFLILHLSLEVLRIGSYTSILRETLTYFNSCFRVTYDTEFAE